MGKKKKSLADRLAAKLNVPREDVEKVVDQLLNAVLTSPITVAVTVHPLITRPPQITLPPNLRPNVQLFLAKQLRMAAEMLQDQALKQLNSQVLPNTEETDNERDTARTSPDENRDKTE